MNSLHQQLAGSLASRICPTALSIQRVYWALLTTVFLGTTFPPTTANAAPAGGEGWSDAFDLPGLTGRVFSLGTYGGTLVAGGEEFQADGQYIDHVARWDGTSWGPLGTGVSGIVRAITEFQGELIVAGEFSVAGGQVVNSIAAWDGTRWRAFGLGLRRASGQPAEVFAVHEFGAELYVGGDFVKAGSKNATGIARWDGSTWRRVAGGVDASDSAKVLALESASDGSLYVGGDFETAGGIPAENVASFDGTSWSTLGTGITGPTRTTVFTLREYQSQIYAGGNFHIAGGNPAERIARWDGSAWSPLGSGIPDWDISVMVSSLEVYGSHLFVGGSFIEAGGVEAHRVARWDGAAWSGVGGVAGSDLKTIVLAMTVFDDKLIVGGEFRFAGHDLTWGQALVTRQIATFDGAQWGQLNPGLGFSLEVYDVVDYAGNKVAVGRFREAGSSLTSQVALFDGTDWQYLGTFNNNVYAAIVYQGDLVVTGEFTQVDGRNIRSAARWDGQRWRRMDTGAGGQCLAIYRGQLYAAGASPRRWNGTTWEQFGDPIGSTVLTMHVHDDVLYIGGSFSGAGRNLVSWDGTSMRGFGSGPDDAVEAMTSFEGKLLIGGRFSSVDGTTTVRIASWDGQQWSQFEDGITGYVVSTLCVFQGELHAGGDLVKYSGDPADSLARWDGSSWHPLDTGIDGYPYVLLPDDETGELTVGGWFYEAGGLPSWNYAVWNASSNAWWNNYGEGLAGTLGVPAFTARTDPVVGQALTLDLQNSAGFPATGLLFVGLSDAAIPGLGGTLLVQPMIMQPVSVPAAGLALTLDLPDDPGLVGVSFYLQTLESDPGATRGVSFTRGLRLALGK